MSPQKKSRVTSVDVAKASGVSQATVSYVLNRKQGQTISDRTREKVLSAVAELGYVQSFAGRTLRQGQSRIVLLDYNDVPRGPGVMTFSDAFSDTLRSHDFPVIVLTHTDMTALSLEQMAQIVSPVAVVSFEPLAAERVEFLRGLGVRYISYEDFAAFDTILLDALASAAVAQIDFLVSRGHREIAYVTPFDPDLTVLGVGRQDAAIERARSQGLELRQIDGTQGVESLDEQLRSLRRHAPGVTALACYNDEVAFPVLASLARLGLKVPLEVAVIGVDDIPLARFAIPALTTVHYDSAAHGTNTADRLLAAMGVDAKTIASENYTPRIAERDSA